MPSDGLYRIQREIHKHRLSDEKKIKFEFLTNLIIQIIR